MEYKILTVGAVSGICTNFEEAALQLSKLVSNEIRSGWAPLGGVATGITQNTKEPYLFQAMLHE